LPDISAKTERDMETGKRIRDLRLKKGMTQEELARQTELSTRTIQRIENGEVDPRAYTLQMIATALGVEYDIFFVEDMVVDKESEAMARKTILAQLHLSGLFLLILPTIMFWQRNREKARGMSDHYRHIIWFQLSYWFFFIIPGLFVLVLRGNIAVVAIGMFLGGYFSIRNAIRVFNDKEYKYPMLFGLRQPRNKADENHSMTQH
jgi:transcriptional regulator with XRE-family HTH domain